MAAHNKSALMALLLLGTIPVAGAGTFSVNTTTDDVDANTADGLCLTAANQCSLRAAIQQANANAEVDVINLPAGVYNLTAGTSSQITSESNNNDGNDITVGDLDITSELTIVGEGADVVAIDGMERDRVFHVLAGGKATIKKVTIRHGSQTNNGVGGGVSVRTDGVAELEDCNVTKNVGRGFGGGLDNFMGTLIVRRCTISDNKVYGNGAGVSNNGGKLEIYDSTISKNGAAQFASLAQGGGIYNSTDTGYAKIHGALITGHSVISDGGGIYHLLGGLELVNSTVSGNEAKRNGGGIYIANSLTFFGGKNTIRHSTITNNRALAQDTSSPSYAYGGGGLFNGNPTNSNTITTYLYNSIIAGNSVGAGGVGSDCHDLGDLVTEWTLIGDTSCIGGNSVINVGIEPLADNGGPTLTHALSVGSVAIDVASDTYCEATDQRGYSRPTNTGNCDAGAVEKEGSPVDVVSPPPADGTTFNDPNQKPLAFSMPYAVVAGGVLHGVLNYADADGDFITRFEFIEGQGPTKGTVALSDLSGGDNAIPGSFEYIANANASGTDSFMYRVCDADDCSNKATISISITSGSPSQEIGITLASGSSGAPTPILVTSPADLQVIAPDPDYTYPLGAFFFDVNDISAASNSNGTEVVIQLPASAQIAADAVVRKLDNTGTWRTLQSTPNPVESTATIDPTARTITLVLRDGDRFDLNPATGVIRDPVGLAVPKATEGHSTSSSGGGGALTLLALAGLLLVTVSRLRGKLLI